MDEKELEALFEEEKTADGYGYYRNDPDGLCLTGVDDEDDRKEYTPLAGTVRIAAGAFSATEHLETLVLPASVTDIEAGALSNGSGWAAPYKGIRRIVPEAGNPVYFSEGDFLCGRKEGKIFLLRYLGGDAHPVVPEAVETVLPGAFFNRKVSTVTLENEDLTILFPSGHGYFLEQLLKGFGQNGLNYDFGEYDRFLLLQHYNRIRIKMLLARLERPVRLSDEVKEALKEHISGHMEEVIKALMAEDAVEELADILAAGFVTAENAEAVIEQLNRAGKAEMLSLVMRYRHEHLETEEFDFTI